MKRYLCIMAILSLSLFACRVEEEEPAGTRGEQEVQIQEQETQPTEEQAPQEQEVQIQEQEARPRERQSPQEQEVQVQEQEVPPPEEQGQMQQEQQ